MNTAELFLKREKEVLSPFAFLTANSMPVQQGTSIFVTVTLLMSLFLKISINFSV